MAPRSLRRLLAVPWLALGLAAGVLGGPIEKLISRISRRVGGGQQPGLVARIVLVYFRCEASFIIAAAALWLAGARGAQLQSERVRAAHYRLEARFFGSLVSDVRRALRISVALEDSREAEDALRAHDRPLLVFSRHAGPGDSFLLVDLMLRGFGRRPLIVMKEAMALDPAIDLVSQRLPNALLDSDDPARCRRQITRATQGLDDRSVLLLFPEGGNFTPRRRRRALRALLRRGHHRRAAQASRMTPLLPPMPGGALAAMEARPDADVIFIAHAGLGIEAFGAQLLRDLPTDRTWRVRMWLAPADSRPAGEQEQTDWLFDWWRRMEEWVAPLEDC